ncbi:peptidylprolyl isomerase [Devosia sp.]|uniref:peptidylprolyl isomerase n=1 Tax=Devosia sp. TaxID=1871048 RepID=UPI0032632885
MASGGWVRAVGAAALVMLLGVVATMPAVAATKITVNGEAITDIQISQRIKLFALEGNNTGTRGATQQLIDEALQLQEAQRLGINVSPSQVDDAFHQVARNLKLTTDRLTTTLQSQGVSIDSLRNRLKAAIAWSGIVQNAVQPRVQISDLQLDQEAAAKVTGINSFDYILKEIIFVAPGGNGAGGRTAQANKYRQQFTGCDTAVDLSLNFTDAAVVDVGRRHATQMPEAIAKELAGLNVGGITKPRVINSGVSMLAVCEKAQAEDLTFIKSDLQAGAGGDALKTEAAKYMDELRAKAKIIRN